MDPQSIGRTRRQLLAGIGVAVEARDGLDNDTQDPSGQELGAALIGEWPGVVADVDPEERAGSGWRGRRYAPSAGCSTQPSTGELINLP